MKDTIGKPRCFGSTIVGPRGQVVIPVSARKDLGMKAGDTLLVFQAAPQHEGLLLLKAEMVEEMLSRMGQMLANLQQQVKKRNVRSGPGKNGG